MPPQRKTKERSPVAERIRSRLAEMGQTESSFSEAFGKDRTTLSTILRRVDQGGNLRSDTLSKLERYLGKPAHWILTGEEVEGVRLCDVDGWETAANEARARYGFSADQVESAGKLRVPKKPGRMDPFVVAGFVRALTDAS